MKSKRDWLAVISNGISGSWARHTTRAKAISECARIFRKDHSVFYKFKKGDTVIVNIVDVTGYQTVNWDDRGFYVGEERLDRPVKRQKFTYGVSK